MKELITKLIPLCVELNKIGEKKLYMTEWELVNFGYLERAAECYTAIENLIYAYASTLENAKINAQSEEIKALRGFAIRMKEIAPQTRGDQIIFYLQSHNLIDRGGNPTKLLTGEK